MMDEVILFLLKRGAHREPLGTTTIEIADALRISQQTASRRLILLEKEGMVRRVGRLISITERGLKEVESLYAALGAALEKKMRFRFHGRVTSGTRDGRYYLSLKKYKEQIREKMGFVPYPGTLNIRVPPDEINLRLLLRGKKGELIEGFGIGERTFGRIICYRCRLNGIDGALVFPERSHHGLDVMEVVALVNLRKKLSLKEGDAVVCDVD
jgi:riboflavin kinase